MANLLLITDIPRLIKIFSRFSDEKDIQLRIVNNLEKGGEEIVADKPSMVFVQTHLSGLSADILLMHLKKQLGRKRTRFVLLSSPGQVSAETLKLYQGQLDTSLEDNALFDAVRELIADAAPKGKKPVSAASEACQPAPQQLAADTANSQEVQKNLPQPGQTPDAQMQAETGALSTIPPSDISEPSLEEQGVTYAPRSRISVYSEFTSSFDHAVSSIQPAEAPDDRPKDRRHAWNHDEIENIESAQNRSRLTTFILWLAPLLITVVVVTMLQYSRSKNKPVDVATIQPQIQAAKPIPAATTPVATVIPPGAKPDKQAPTAGADLQLSDKAMLQAIAENRGQKEATSASQRPTALPDFIPRAGRDKQYSAANPGWERYKGNVTEFKIYRENDSIKAIQVIDRGGQGVPESFMKGVLKQLSKKPVFVMETTEKKDGYEIQRGQIADNIKVVFYRDEKGGRLRAFVTTWK